MILVCVWVWVWVWVCVCVFVSVRVFLYSHRTVLCNPSQYPAHPASVLILHPRRAHCERYFTAKLEALSLTECRSKDAGHEKQNIHQRYTHCRNEEEKELYVADMPWYIS